MANHERDNFETEKSHGALKVILKAIVKDAYNVAMSIISALTGKDRTPKTA